MKIKSKNRVQNVKKLYYSADIIHTLKNGEDLYYIARMYNIDIDTLIIYNQYFCYNLIYLKEIRIPCFQILSIKINK